MKAIIVDDEKIARDKLNSLLKEYSEINVCGEASDIASALELISNENPDIIFLDINLSGESGFDLLNKIEPNKKIIFTTAYDEFALRAFEVNALDYLLKPIKKQRLKDAILKLKTVSNNKNKLIIKLNYDDYIFINELKKVRFLKLKDIVFFSSSSPYTFIHTVQKEKIAMSKSLNEWESLLPDSVFLRIHRSTIININYVISMEKWFNYTNKVYLESADEPLTMSRRYAQVLKKKSR